MFWLTGHFGPRSEVSRHTSVPRPKCPDTSDPLFRSDMSWVRSVRLPCSVPYRTRDKTERVSVPCQSAMQVWSTHKEALAVQGPRALCWELELAYDRKVSQDVYTCTYSRRPDEQRHRRSFSHPSLSSVYAIPFPAARPVIVP